MNLQLVKIIKFHVLNCQKLTVTKKVYINKIEVVDHGINRQAINCCHTKEVFCCKMTNVWRYFKRWYEF